MTTGMVPRDHIPASPLPRLSPPGETYHAWLDLRAHGLRAHRGVSRVVEPLRHHYRGCRVNGWKRLRCCRCYQFWRINHLHPEKFTWINRLCPNCISEAPKMKELYVV